MSKDFRGAVFFSVGFESNEQEFGLKGVKSKKISSHPGMDGWLGD